MLSYYASSMDDYTVFYVFFMIILLIHLENDSNLHKY